MTSRYQLRRVGVWDDFEGVVHLPGSFGWAEYLVWTSSGGVVDPEPVVVHTLTQAEIDADAEAATRKSIRDELRADAAIRALCTRTPTQVNSWIDSNVTDLASARTVLKIIARVLALIARETLPPPDASSGPAVPPKPTI